MSFSIVSTPTPLGEFHMIIEGEVRRGRARDVVRASGFGKLGDLLLRFSTDVRLSDMKDAPASHPYARALAAYFKGDARALDAIEHRQEGTEFQRRIWKAMSKIKPGEAVSYQDLAERTGDMGAERAVGSACARNLLVLLVPCHRVIKSDGSLGQYLYGTAIKKSLLELEGVA